jgi:hypothetical protein
MKRIVVLSLFTLIITGAVCAQDAQQKPSATPAKAAPAPSPAVTVEQILDRYVEAIGGRAAMEKLTTRESRGTFEIAGTPLKGTVENYGKAPNKLASFTRVAGLGDFLEGHDGQISWTRDPTNGLRERSGAELAQAKFDAEFYKELKFKELYSKMELKGKEKVGGREAYLIVGTPAASSPEKLYFDTQTGLLLRMDLVRESPQGKTPFEVYFEDYREVDGVKIPFVQRQNAPDFSVTIKFDTIKHNVTIDDAKFSKPVPQ